MLLLPASCRRRQEGEGCFSYGIVEEICHEGNLPSFACMHQKISCLLLAGGGKFLPCLEDFLRGKFLPAPLPSSSCLLRQEGEASLQRRKIASPEGRQKFAQRHIQNAISYF